MNAVIDQKDKCKLDIIRLRTYLSRDKVAKELPRQEEGSGKLDLKGTENYEDRSHSAENIISNIAEDSRAGGSIETENC